MFDHHGRTEAADRLSTLSREQRWDEMEAPVSDEIAEKVRRRRGF